MRSKEFRWQAAQNGLPAQWQQTEEKWRVFDGLDVVQERDANNLVTAQLVRDGNIGGILSRTTAVGTSYFHYDGSGNVAALSSETGALVGRYSYDAFGNTIEATGQRAADNPYRFSTKELHAQSGLVDFGYRFYSPSLGRWINRDPIREDGGLNLYGFVGNNPVNESDEYGLAKKTYQVYYKPMLGPVKGVPYIGITSGTNKPIRNVQIRDNKHNSEGNLKGFGYSRLLHSGTYAECKGLEDRLIREYGGGWKKGGTSNNPNNGIEKRNEAGKKRYYRASSKVWKSIWPRMKGMSMKAPGYLGTIMSFIDIWKMTQPPRYYRNEKTGVLYDEDGNRVPVA